MGQQSHRPHDYFPSTHWSMVGAVQQLDEESAAAALGRLLQRYQGALTLYVARKFLVSEHDAADLFQGFVADVVLHRRLIHKAKCIEGRQFRSYLISVLHRFVVSCHRRSETESRKPPGGHVPLEDAQMEVDLASTGAAAGAFDVAWAQGVLQQAFDRMKAECGSNGRLQVWQLFERRLLDPILHVASPVPYEDLVRQFRWTSP